MDEVVESLSHLNREEGVARLVLHIASEALDQPLDKHVRAGQLGQPDRRFLDPEKLGQRELIDFVDHSVAVQIKVRILRPCVVQTAKRV